MYDLATSVGKMDGKIDSVCTSIGEIKDNLSRTVTKDECRMHQEGYIRATRSVVQEMVNGAIEEKEEKAVRDVLRPIEGEGGAASAMVKTVRNNWPLVKTVIKLVVTAVGVSFAAGVAWQWRGVTTTTEKAKEKATETSRLVQALRKEVREQMKDREAIPYPVPFPVMSPDTPTPRHRRIIRRASPPRTVTSGRPSSDTN